MRLLLLLYALTRLLNAISAAVGAFLFLREPGGVDRIRQLVGAYYDWRLDWTPPGDVYQTAAEHYDAQMALPWKPWPLLWRLIFCAFLFMSNFNLFLVVIGARSELNARRNVHRRIASPEVVLPKVTTAESYL